MVRLLLESGADKNGEGGVPPIAPGIRAGSGGCTVLLGDLVLGTSPSQKRL